MRILILRHGDPDYSIDSLTARGKIEAKLLAERLLNEKIDKVYSSPLGRAKLTCEICAEKKGFPFTVEESLHEFSYKLEDTPAPSNFLWDKYPAYWTEDLRFYDPEKWLEVPWVKNSIIPEKYKNLCEFLDKTLSEYGYNRYHNYYKVEKESKDTLALFCHFGTECMILSHLIRVSPFFLLHNFFGAPTSFTEIYTEEREQGNAIFRVSVFGDVGHLLKGGVEPSPAGRFKEVFSDPIEILKGD